MDLPPSMILLLELGAILIAVLGALWLFRWLLESRFKPSSKGIKYTLKSSLVTDAERSFLGCLDSVLPPEIRVFAKVRLADLFSVERSSNRTGWRAAFNRIQSKHVDFLLCKSDDLSPLVAIELDDKTHAANDRQERDRFLNDLFANSRIKLLRIPAQKSYDPGELAQRLNEAFQAE
ncbi:MAG: DUF2726 domain-containing protein [Methylacidiphilales bacterium]|nr:DUF2726 domain-containing protein [Candidatus Methylacidiphilales bacterium]